MAESSAISAFSLGWSEHAGRIEGDVAVEGDDDQSRRFLPPG
jgi:hypothetical protein